MQVKISGQHISMGESLQEYVSTRTNQVVSKYFKNASSIHINFSKQGRSFVSDIVVNDGTGRHMLIKSRAISDEIYHSYDTALSKVEKQMRKYKSKLQSHHKNIKPSEAMSKATKYVISPSSQEEEIEDNPVIVAEKATDILEFSVSDAVMHMDLQNLPALMFINSKTGRTNIVYYRKDGNISWVDSK